MCCLFGLIDYNHSLSTRQKNRILSVLAASCEVRGTDATGIAYHSKGRLRVYKRPIPAHLLRFSLPDDANVIMGHTRMTTQGDARKNFNNHPFCGSSDNGPFALAHNGVIYNDDRLRGPNKLQKPKIETDSFVAVQLLEQKRTLNFSSLRYMAEQVEGSFTFTVLDAKDNLYIVKGDNPLCLYHYPRLGIYLYASTQEILNQALARLALPGSRPDKSGSTVVRSCGSTAPASSPVTSSMTASCFATAIPCTGGLSIRPEPHANPPTIIWRKSSQWHPPSAMIQRRSINWLQRDSHRRNWRTSSTAESCNLCQ